MKPGDYSEVSRVFSKVDIEAYSALSAHTVAGEQVPEPLVGALFSYLLGVKLPGLGTNYLKQETRFLLTATIGDELKARVEITRIRPDKHLVDLATTCHRSNGDVIANGRALVYIGDLMQQTANDS